MILKGLDVLERKIWVLLLNKLLVRVLFKDEELE